MIAREQYAPGSASGARVIKDGIQKDNDKWTLILVRELRHSPEKVWQALTDPVQLREWAPFVVDGNMGTVGTTVKLTWVGTPAPIDTKVTQADVAKVLEYGDIRWEFEAFGGGTRLTLWHNIDRRFVAWGAAGWHIAFDVLDRLLSGNPIGRIVGGDAIKSEGWRRLRAEYAEQFGSETAGRRRLVKAFEIETPKSCARDRNLEKKEGLRVRAKLSYMVDIQIASLSPRGETGAYNAGGLAPRDSI